MNAKTSAALTALTVLISNNLVAQAAEGSSPIPAPTARSVNRFAQAVPGAPGTAGGFGTVVGVPGIEPVGVETSWSVGGGGGGNPFWEPFGRAGKRTLVIMPAKPEGSSMGNLEEDLNVMSRVLDKAVEKASESSSPQEKAMGIVVSSLGGSRQPENIYIDGYGVLFLLNVRMPLVSAPSKTEEKTEEKGDSAWDQARRELYGPRFDGSAKMFRADGDRPAPKYDAEKVDHLKRELLMALKNASNIRGLKSDESITVVVSGADNGTYRDRLQKIVRGGGGSSAAASNGKLDTDAMNQLARVSVVTAGGRPSTLFIRVKKSDADSFGKGKLDFEEFRKKAQVSAY
jgi:hypothetical protein